MAKFRKYCQFKLTLDGNTFKKDMAEDNIFSMAMDELHGRVMGYYVRGTVEKLEQAMVELMILLGDYAVEYIRYQMPPSGEDWGVGGKAWHTPHVLTGSFLSAIQNQYNKKTRSTYATKNYGSVHSTLQIGIDPDFKRYEQSSIFNGPINSNVRLYNTGESVAEYGKRYFDQMITGMNLTEEVRGVLKDLIESAGMLSRWLAKHSSSNFRNLEIYQMTEQLRMENLQKIQIAAMNRIARAMAGRK